MTHIKAIGGKSAYITELKPYKVLDRLGSSGAWIEADNNVLIFASTRMKKSRHLPNGGRFVFCNENGEEL